MKIKTTREDLRRTLNGLRIYSGKDNPYAALSFAISQENVLAYATNGLSMMTLVSCPAEIEEGGTFAVTFDLERLLGAIEEGEITLSLSKDGNSLHISGPNRFRARMATKPMATLGFLDKLQEKIASVNIGFECIIAKEQLLRLVRTSILFGASPQATGVGTWVVLQAGEDGCLHGSTQSSEKGGLEEVLLDADVHGSGQIVLHTSVLNSSLLLCGSSVRLQGGATRMDGSIFSDPESSYWQHYAAQMQLPGEKPS